ncbi:MAG TPA: efflux RND transporter periplasmic adaptor subunit [Anaerolineales bacterium]|nr:efflux RND transporter periplasmic adaptor subunit [Anaerolineales bacterium]HMR99138.1 efflux RND transporter periplasmic adaptor subunit [Anaerolineales bacterium]HNS62597.1 efflux RND transporter periplasmic adaptor subunit [Anaerolineales bacterium]
MHKPPLAVRIIVILIVLSTIGYYAFRSLAPDKNTQLKASGTIESVIVNVSPEMAGKVKEVLVDEGQPVKTGDPLLSLDGGLLTAQRAVASAQIDSANAALNTAAAAYASAQQQYDLTLNNALAQEQSTRTSDWRVTNLSEFDQPSWYFSKTERLAAAQADVDATLAALKDAQENLNDIQQSAGGSRFLDLEATLSKTRVAYQNAKAAYDKTVGASNGQDLRDAAQIVLDDADLALDDAQSAYDDALSTDDAADVLEARAKVAVAQEIYDTAVDNLRSLQTGADSQQVITASKALEQSKAAVAQAQATVNTAQANLDLIDTQIAKLTIYAPMDGIILTRNVEPGEFVQPGSVALAMANLNEMTITVYVPENRLNEIKLGQQASVTIDVASGESPVFTAEIIHIADQAEFTPRNVQTVEGRSSTVYAVKLKVTDSQGWLKIGMPADVVFK